MRPHAIVTALLIAYAHVDHRGSADETLFVSPPTDLPDCIYRRILHECASAGMLGRALEISGSADSTSSSPRRSSMVPRWSRQIPAATTGSVESSPWVTLRISR